MSGQLTTTNRFAQGWQASKRRVNGSTTIAVEFQIAITPQPVEGLAM